MTEWTKINISKEMSNYVKGLIGNPVVKRKYDFQSVADFVRAALSDKIKEVEREISEP